MNAQNFITSPVDMGSASVSFIKHFAPSRAVASVTLCVSAIGLFEARLNGQKLGRGVLTPGFTSYRRRTQYVTYDLTPMLLGNNTLSITAAPGWAVGTIGYRDNIHCYAERYAVNAEISILYADGGTQSIVTDDSWTVQTSPIEYSDIYHGETVNLLHKVQELGHAVPDPEAAGYPLIPQQGADITEHERLAPISLFTTPKGERVIDFGQNMTGYVEFRIKAEAGERIVITHAEVLDADGNFYTENYRSAKNLMTYVCDGKENVFKPTFSFQGFRYIRLDEYPNVEVDLSNIRAIAVHSDMRRTGRFSCGNPKINQLYHNTVWGQKSNYLDIPTDCPQRDERLGWTGDAQVFCRTAALNYDVRSFCRKWLGDMRADQLSNGVVLGIIPNTFEYVKDGYSTRISAAWGDAATIIPWELYRAYGDKSFLSDNFDMMTKWVEYQHSAGSEEYLWLGGRHYGDWLAMDAGEDSYVGATANDLIASAFFAHSIDLLVRAGEVLGKDMSQYRELHAKIKAKFREYFMENGMPREEFPLTESVSGKTPVDSVRKGITQTALVLILHFDLCTDEERPALADKLEELIHVYGDLMTTGFVGTPYILHVLNEAGKTELAYKLLLEERSPSWLYSVMHGATTMWEHWNSIKEDGSFWSTAMNSFNHYAYGSVCDWLYGVAAGITATEEDPGYRTFTLSPKPCRALEHVDCTLDTLSGHIESHWYYKGDEVYFEFTVPDGAKAYITLPNGYKETVDGGVYHYTTKA